MTPLAWCTNFLTPLILHHHQPHMRPPFLLALLAFPLLSFAQSAQLSTSWIIQQTVGSNQQTSTISQATIITIGPTPSQTGSAGGSSSIISSGSASNASATTASGGNSTSTSVAPSNLPTAPTSVAGADGGGPNGAPSPGASAAGGIYGPPDGYIAGAEAVRSPGVIGVIGSAAPPYTTSLRLCMDFIEPGFPNFGLFAPTPLT
ncbi:hypothetical protein F5I97DRAFT_1929873 [Phlebopus sp. FC_14]|nr:hypothetical protein F5I97DRAFT_1929873 [Phlebopus sp. FC_14]